MSTRQQQIADAAIAVLADGGARRLTHRAVDAAAGLPAGSTSNLFPRRAELIAGILQHMLAREQQAVTALSRSPMLASRTFGESQLVAFLDALIADALGPRPPRHTSPPRAVRRGGHRPRGRSLPILVRSDDRPRQPRRRARPAPPGALVDGLRRRLDLQPARPCRMPATAGAIATVELKSGSGRPDDPTIARNSRADCSSCGTRSPGSSMQRATAIGRRRC